MDFSNSQRALESLGRRRPALPEDLVDISKQLLDPQTSSELYLSGIDTLLKATRWEGLSVGLLLATQVLNEDQVAKNNAQGVVYIEGPRVPEEQESKEASSSRSFSPNQLSETASHLHQASLLHLEHSEPRVRTFVAKAVGAHATWSLTQPLDGPHAQERQAIHEQIVNSISQHLKYGRDETEKYSKSSTGALDDTTGWRALETNWQCLACWIASVGPAYYETALPNTAWDALLENLEYSAVTHVNRHVRAAAIAVLEQLIVAAGQDSKQWHHLESGKLRHTLVQVLKAGLGDNWSQVRMAASVLNRVFWATLQDVCRFDSENVQQLYPVLVPRMCLNRFYLAQGVKLYSHQTWKQIFPTNGVDVVAQTMAPLVRYYVKMCDADNHVVREAACQAVAELSVKIGRHPTHAPVLQPHVPILLQALIMCFHDESWPVRDEACLACGTFCRAYPEECRGELGTLWERWTEQLTDQIWSVRADAAVALGQACQAYGEDFLEKLMKFIQEKLPAAKEQPKMTVEEYKALQNNMEAHTDSQLYSCGSLAPKLKKKAGAGRIGCSSCGITRPKQPWEATDGCLYLIRELVDTCSEADSTLPQMDDNVLLPLLEQVADICRVSHFPQADDLRATLWRQLPSMMHAVGKQRCKKFYLEIFMDLLMRNLESRTASAISKHAAGTCAYELGQLVGPSIFRGRIYDERQQRVLDEVLRERQLDEERNQMNPMGRQAAPGKEPTQFSPFEPPGLLDNLDSPYSNKMQPGLPQGMLNTHPGLDDTMSI